MSAAREYMYEALQRKGWSASESDYSKSNRLLEENHHVPTILKFPLYQFMSDEVMLNSNKPVEITLFYDDSQFYASSDSLNIYAVGDTMESVMNDFSQHVVYFFNYYSNKDEVIGDAVRLKDIYENYFNLVR